MSMRLPSAHCLLAAVLPLLLAACAAPRHEIVANTPGSNGLGTLQQGYVETSNVNVVEELVSMIQTQRAYEINSKAIQTSDQMLARLAQL